MNIEYKYYLFLADEIFLQAALACTIGATARPTGMLDLRIQTFALRTLCPAWPSPPGFYILLKAAISA